MSCNSTSFNSFTFFLLLSNFTLAMQTEPIDLVAQNERVIHELSSLDNEENEKLRAQVKAAETQMNALKMELIKLGNQNTPPKPVFTLIPYKEATKTLSEEQMDKLFDNAPATLRGMIIALMESGDQKAEKILLKGPAGVGKTSLARTIAYKCKCPYVFIDGTDLADQYKDSARPYINALFEKLTESKESTALIIDEFNAFTDKMSNPNDSDTGAVQHFWVKLEEYQNKIIFIATTNQTKKIPTPMLDRFGAIYKIGYSSYELRKNVLEQLSSTMDIKTKKHLLDLASQADSFSLRDLAQIIKQAKYKAFARAKSSNTTITTKDIDDAFREVQKFSKKKLKKKNESRSEKNLQQFNQYYLPLAQLLINSGITITGLVIQHYIVQENNVKALEQQSKQHQDFLRMHEQHHNESSQQTYAHNNKSLNQSTAIGIAPLVGQAAEDAINCVIPGAGGFVKHGATLATATFPIWSPHTYDWIYAKWRSALNLGSYIVYPFTPKAKLYSISTPVNLLQTSSNKQ